MQKSLPYFLNRVAKTRSEKEAGRKKFRWMCHPPRGARTEPCALSLSSQFPFVLLNFRRPSFSPSPLRPPPFPLPLPSLPLSLLSPSQGEGSARARRNGPMDKQPPPRRRRKWVPRGSATSQPRPHLSPSSPPPLPLCARCRARPAAGAAPRSRKDSAMQPDGRGVARPAHGRSGTVPAPAGRRGAASRPAVGQGGAGCAAAAAETGRAGVFSLPRARAGALVAGRPPGNVARPRREARLQRRQQLKVWLSSFSWGAAQSGSRCKAAHDLLDRGVRPLGRLLLQASES